MKPLIKFYGVFERIYKEGRITPKYALKYSNGVYAPMAEIVGIDGKVSLYLKHSRDCGSNKRSAPELRLEAKNSLNFTGLKPLFVDGGKLSKFAYGNPFQKKEYIYKGKPRKNPFYEYREDGFLFIMHQAVKADTSKGMLLPYKIEILILDGAKNLIDVYCKQLEMGGYNDELCSFRKMANT